MNAIAKYDRRAVQASSLLCVGLDCDIEHVPERFRGASQPQFEWNRFVIEQTHPYVSAYKPNSAFYEARGAQGMRELQLTVDYLRDKHPDIPIICDAKRGDNATTNRAYARAVFDQLGVDAVTLQPYMGRRVLEPFLERADRGCIVLCRTSNPGDDALQELRVSQPGSVASVPLWQHVAEQVRDSWNTYGNCMFVVGATHPHVMRQVKQIAPDIPILAPGLGAQGGDVSDATQAGVNAFGRGLILSASRSVMLSADPAQEARQLRDEINRARR